MRSTKGASSAANLACQSMWNRCARGHTTLPHGAAPSLALPPSLALTRPPLAAPPPPPALAVVPMQELPPTAAAEGEHTEEASDGDKLVGTVAGLGDVRGESWSIMRDVHVGVTCLRRD